MRRRRSAACSWRCSSRSPGNRSPDIKAHFAMLLDEKAWTKAALVLTACALPGYRVQTNGGCGPSRVILFAPKADGSVATTPSEPAQHAGGVPLAMLVAVLTELSTDSAR